MTRKIVSILLALCLLIGCVPMMASAAETSGNCGPEGNETGVTWKIENGTLTISGSGAMKDGPGDWSKDDVKSVVIGEGVTSVGGGAFSGCTSLTSLTFSDSVTSIGMSAFDGCIGLISVTIPKSVTSIGMGAFAGCSNLKSAIFEGNAPQLQYLVFSRYPDDFSIYYADGATGWTTPTWTSWAQNTYPCKPLSQMNPDKPNPPVNPDPPVTPSEPTVETVTTEDGNTATVTTQPGGDKAIEVKTPSGETVAKVNLPADPGKGKTFTDVKGWYEGAVDKATAYGLFQGTSETRFSPNSFMTRGMLANVLYNLSGKTSYGVGEGAFADVTENIWYEDAADWAAKTGVTSGTGKAEFSPNKSVTRQDMVTMLYRYAKLIGVESKNSAGLEKFPDAGKVSGYAKEAMQWAVAEGFISGRTSGGKNCIAPQGTATRAEVAAVLTRFVEYLKK